MAITKAQTVPCPTCFAPAGQPCTAPTDTGRRAVTWVHVRRGEQLLLASLRVRDNEYFLTFGIAYYDEPHPMWPECNPKGYVRIIAPDYEQARLIAIERFGLDWSTLTPSANFNRRFFPAGELMVLP